MGLMSNFWAPFVIAVVVRRAGIAGGHSIPACAHCILSSECRRLSVEPMTT